jgi:hypothetical protein
MIATQRTFRIRKGSFAEFHRLSAHGVWPYFERIGARILGMWLVTEDEREPSSPDYDTVILVTRYESREHWQATRNPVALGGEGPVWDRCRDALLKRHALTVETWLRFLDPGELTAGGPYFK